MKKFHLRYAALLLAALMLLTAAFTACKKPDAPDGGTSSGTDTEPAPAELVLIGGGETYNIIRGSYANEAVLDAVKGLRKTLTTQFGDVWQGIITEDWEQGVGKDDIVDNDNAEILIGLTNRRESHTVYDTLGENEYTVRTVGKKLVIIGSDDYATVQAVAAFTSDYIVKSDGKTLSVSGSLNVSGTASLRKIPINGEAKYRLMSWNLGGGIGNADDVLDIMLRYLPDILSLDLKYDDSAHHFQSHIFHNLQM